MTLDHTMDCNPQLDAFVDNFITVQQTIIELIISGAPDALGKLYLLIERIKEMAYIPKNIRIIFDCSGRGIKTRKNHIDMIITPQLFKNSILTVLKLRNMLETDPRLSELIHPIAFRPEREFDLQAPTFFLLNEKGMHVALRSDQIAIMFLVDRLQTAMFIYYDKKLEETAPGIGHGIVNMIQNILGEHAVLTFGQISLVACADMKIDVPPRAFKISDLKAEWYVLKRYRFATVKKCVTCGYDGTSLQLKACKCRKLYFCDKFCIEDATHNFDACAL